MNIKREGGGEGHSSRLQKFLPSLYKNYKKIIFVLLAKEKHTIGHVLLCSKTHLVKVNLI